jgi:hypothetical protein
LINKSVSLFSQWDLAHIIFIFRSVWKFEIRRGADKSLARPTSRSRRTKSRVSLEKGVCLCAELQDCSCNRSCKKYVRRRVRFQQHRDARFHQVFLPCKARRRWKFTLFWEKH